MPEKTGRLASQLATLTKRIEKLESRLGETSRHDVDAGDHEGTRQCTLPQVAERKFDAGVSLERQRLVRYLDKKWVNGTKLRYYMFDSGNFAPRNQAQVDLVREGFGVWEAVGIGVQFEEVGNIGEAEVRIGFLSGDGAWSYVGRDVIDIPGQVERTMNFGWDLSQDPRGVDVPVHEIGHTLGFPHEHQNPFAGIVWDEEAVYRYFGGPPNNWSRESTLHNVLSKLPANAVEGSEWDPDSIMHYGFPGGLILTPEQYRDGLEPAPGLSESDIEEVRRFYPPSDGTRDGRLEPMRLEPLSLAPAEQKNFRIEPPYTGEFTIQTFGHCDTVMVLFEDVDGEMRFVAGDDDSGSALNSKIGAHLRYGRRYILRIRLYLKYASGEAAVMMW